MKDYPWPSNIRELRNVVERTILCKESEIDAADLPEELRDHKQEPQQDKPLSAYDLSPTGDQFPTLSELEDRYIHYVLNATGQNKTHAARISWHPSYLAHAVPEEAEGSRLTTSRPVRHNKSVTRPFKDASIAGI